MSPTDRLHTIRDFRLTSGATMPEAAIAYVTQGRLAPDGRNAILLTHGYTSSHHFADGEGASEGSWGALVGPGKPIDTERYFVGRSQHAGLLLRLDRTGQPQPRDRPPLWAGFPRHHALRHRGTAARAACATRA